MKIVKIHVFVWSWLTGWLHRAVCEVTWCDIAYGRPSSFWPPSSLSFLKSQQGEIQSEIVNITAAGWEGGDGSAFVFKISTCQAGWVTGQHCDFVSKCHQTCATGEAQMSWRDASHLSYSSLSCGWAGRTCSGPAESGWLEGGPGRWSQGGRQCSPETHTGVQFLECKICPQPPATAHLHRLKRYANYKNKLGLTPRSVYMWARWCMRCMPAVLWRLYHYISARQAVGSACDLLFYITALPSILSWTLLRLSPRTTSSPLCSSPCSPRFPALLFGFLCQPVLFRAIFTDSQTLSGGAGWCVHYRNRLLAHISEHCSSTIKHLREMKRHAATLDNTRL